MQLKEKKNIITNNIKGLPNAIELIIRKSEIANKNSFPRLQPTIQHINKS